MSRRRSFDLAVDIFKTPVSTQTEPWVAAQGSYFSGGGGLGIASRLRARVPIFAFIDADRLGEQTSPGPTIYGPRADAMPLCESAVGFELPHALLRLPRGIRDIDGGGHVAPHRSDCDGASATTSAKNLLIGLIGN